MSTAAPAQRASSSQPRMVTHVTGPNSDLEVSSPKAFRLWSASAVKVENAA